VGKGEAVEGEAYRSALSSNTMSISEILNEYYSRRYLLGTWISIPFRTVACRDWLDKRAYRR